MFSVAGDTHSFVWFFSRDPRLSQPARRAFVKAVDESAIIYVPTICLVELTYLIEKGKIPSDARSSLLEEIDSDSSSFVLAPLDRAVADVLRVIPRPEVPDLPDRIIAATALALNVPLVSADRRIRSSVVRTIW